VLAEAAIFKNNFYYVYKLNWGEYFGIKVMKIVRDILYGKCIK
jgi:hypothetical protein